MKRSEMPQKVFEVLVSIEVLERLLRIEKLYTENCQFCQKRDNSTQTDQTFIINQSEISEFVKILIIWFLWSIIYIIYHLCKSDV